MIKTNSLKKIVAFFLILVTFCSSLSLFAFAEGKRPPFPDTSGASYIYLYNYQSNNIIFSKGALEKRIAPASTVKLMSGYLALKHLADRLDEKITVTDAMLSGVEGFTVGIKPGDILSISDILYSLICGSGNDAAHIVAHLCSGDVNGFVSEMNETALLLGMSNTHYTNPTGLDDSNSYTTVADTAIISKLNAESALFMKLSTTGKYTYIPENSDTERNVYNRNALHSTFYASGYKSNTLQGLNAGSTDKGGYCVVAYTNDGQNSYLCIVMGGQQYSNDNIASYRIVNALTTYYLDNYSYVKIAEKGDIIAERPIELALPTNGYDSVYISAMLDADIYAYAPKNIDYSKELTYKAYFHSDKLTAPVAQGAILGGVDIYFNDEYLASGKLLAETNIQESKLLVFLASMKSAIISRTSIIFVLLILPSVITFLYLTEWRKQRIRKR